MSKSFKYKDNNYLDSSSVAKGRETLKDYLGKSLELFNDTSGTDVKEMLRNKMELCYQQCKNFTNFQMFINGGWSGNNFGFGIYSKIGTTQQIVWFSTFGIRYCRKYGNTYEYRGIDAFIL